MRRELTAFVLLLVVASGPRVDAQIHLIPDQVRREALSAEANIERMVMVPMRDGVHLASRIYIPKSGVGPYPTILWRSPYNFSEKMIPNPDYPDANLKFALDAVRHGYVFVMQNERGKFFSEGKWEILGRPRTDGFDTLSWIAKQRWSNGKVATIGCSSTAEWIMGLASKRHPAHRAAVPMSAGAGIGRVGRYYEQGNFYRGGAVQIPMVAWLYGEQNLLRPTLPSQLSRDERIRVARYYDLAPDMPSVNWNVAMRHLPFSEVITAAGGPNGIFDDMIQRGPDDPKWYRGGLYHDDEDFTVPALWVNSWYDLSVAPNLELYNHVRQRASDPYIRNNQYMIVGPTEHCHMYRLRNPHVVGDRSMGNVDIGLDAIVYEFLDRYLKGNENGFEDRNPKVRYFAMGANRWNSSSSWPPHSAAQLTMYLSAKSGANSLYGDGILATQPPTESGRDTFLYDPQNPVPSRGGNVCCLGDTLPPGSFDQREIEARDDVLVYRSEILTKDIEVTGPISVTLFVSSDSPDTDFTVKLLDVDESGSAWNLDESVQRVRYRNGYDKQAFMKSGQVYELQVGPLVTSNVYKKGHIIGLEISSSSYPRFERNLNTGRNNAEETHWRTAENSVHFGKKYPSHIDLSVIQGQM